MILMCFIVSCVIEYEFTPWYLCMQKLSCDRVVPVSVYEVVVWQGSFCTEWF